MATFTQLRMMISSTAEYAAQGLDPRTLQRRCAAGAAIRLRQGVYVAKADWVALDQWDQYRLAILAVQLTAHRPPVFSHETAAIVHGLPLVSVPRCIHVQQGLDRSARSHGNVRRHYSSCGFPPVVTLSGLLVTSLESTLVALAAGSNFAAAILAFDSVLRDGMLDRARVLEAAEVIQSTAGRGRVASVLNFADAAAESPGESFSRVLILLMGFAAPELQQPFSDTRGTIGRTDFYWPENRLVGEFDGAVKYSNPEFLRGRTPSQVVIDEKRREDRLRALGLRVVRWTWDDLRNPGRLRELLVSAGLVLGRTSRLYGPSVGRGVRAHPSSALPHSTAVTASLNDFRAR